MGLPVLLEEICRLILGISLFPEKEYINELPWQCNDKGMITRDVFIQIV
jgi:hypothetical protein